MPIFKRKGIKKSKHKCEACALKGVNVDLQLIENPSEDEISFILGKIDYENTRLLNKISDKARYFYMSNYIRNGNYKIWKCYVCSWFKLVKK